MKKLFNNRRSGGWNLIEIIVAVAIGASIAAAGVVAYQGEAKKAAVAKAKQFISQVETKKAAIISDINAGNATPPTNLAVAVLSSMKVNGTPMTGVVTTDAPLLGFLSYSVGTLDTTDPNTGVSSGGTAASVSLNGGTTLTGGASAVAGSY